jgi:hypothetical protein
MDEINTAAKKGDHQLLRTLLNGVSLPDDYALGLAAIGGHVECVKLLIDVSTIHIKKTMAFRWAAQNNHLGCVKVLLPYSTTSSRTKALKAAVVFKNQEMVDLLAPSSDAKRVYDEFVSKGLSEQAKMLEMYKNRTIKRR